MPVVRHGGFARAAALSGIAALILTAAGCAATAPEPAPSPTVPVYVSTYETPAPTELAPLRGTTVPAGSLAHSAIAAKVDNHWDARPQVGLESTDIVYEELVEGGITRYVAIWQSTIPELLGPVRSIRPMDPDIAAPYGGIIAYSGGQQRFVNLMQATPVYNAIHGMGDTANTFFRTDSKRAPHNVLVKATEVVAQHADIPAPAQQWAYSLDAASSSAAKEGAPVSAIHYRFSNMFDGSWTYDPDSQTYLRIQQGSADLDSSGNQLRASNVVVLRVGVVDDQGVPKTLLEGSGEAWISTGGGTIHGTWSKASQTEPLQFTDDRGFGIRLGAGNTWVELVPTRGSVEFTAAG